ncbi:SHOCT domain-containing protein [Amycolatopsis cihanbeyliensis]|uniref:Putative membrane protein n=1 Tax=Amycolatopsis cihanbeyliensis TaxID=1128664 RepID=A0A542DE08_AMYCI|nr:SHOCT domain-containing protein [Amycolatopsis cihanbeyliensis]TQJ01300.1 putative membrane protein [Amycolatopsis cihanbeyliensis]
MHRFYDQPGPSWLGWLLMTVTMVLFWGGLISVVVVLVRRFARQAPPSTGPRSDSAEEVLAGRFARGEIDEDEYRKRRDALRE